MSDRDELWHEAISFEQNRILHMIQTVLGQAMADNCAEAGIYLLALYEEIDEGGVPTIAEAITVTRKMQAETDAQIIQLFPDKPPEFTDAG